MRFASSALVAAALLASLTPLAAQELTTPRGRPTLTVSGEGTATAAPDMARFSTGAVSEAKTAREALDANNRLVADMVAALKGAGIEARDIATSGFSVQPQYAPPKKDSAEAPRITGYQVRNTVTVRVRDLAKLGDLLDQMVTSGANQIGSIAFDIAEPQALQDAARAQAVKDARRQAEIIAEAAGLRLMRVVNIVGEAGLQPMPRMAATPMMLKADSVPVEAGESEVRAGVSITFEIEPR